METILHIIDSDNAKPVTKLEFGKLIRFVLELINSSDARVEFRFSDSRQYDFEVRDVSNQLLWNGSYGQLFTQAETAINLEAGEKVKFSVLWDQKDNQSKQVSPEIYSVIGMIVSPNLEIQTQIFTIEQAVR